MGESGGQGVERLKERGGRGSAGSLPIFTPNPSFLGSFIFYLCLC